MDMVFLILLWLGIGACVGLIASAAHLQPATQQSFGWLRTLIVGMGSAFCGGWLGILFFGRPFTIPMALWIAVVGVVCIPWLIHMRKGITRGYSCRSF
jgi:uncharacterized membrane protein YeaQ/YmgE (transglycosylase-associated protein family)